MPQPTFKLSTPTIAILNDNAQPRVVTIDAYSLVTLMDGDAEGNGFVTVRCEDKLLSMFAIDLRTRGERVRGHSA